MSRSEVSLIARNSLGNRRWNKTGDGGRHDAFVAVVDGDERDCPAGLADPAG